ncbi:hypothetical protein G9A89_005696 [Geosiphon pyriformis]|nr:hypothetical protein G9A89_005696 [Geosiphon pyriformis]
MIEFSTIILDTVNDCDYSNAAPIFSESEFLSKNETNAENFSPIEDTDTRYGILNSGEEEKESLINIYLESHDHMEHDLHARTDLDMELDEEELYIPAQALEPTNALPHFPFVVDDFPKSITNQNTLEAISQNFSYLLVNHAPHVFDCSPFNNDFLTTKFDWGFSAMIKSDLKFNEINPNNLINSSILNFEAMEMSFSQLSAI